MRKPEGSWLLDPEERAAIDEAARRAVRGQEPEGSWLLDPEERAAIDEAARRAVRGQEPEGSWLLDDDERHRKMSRSDQAELAAYRAAQARRTAKYTGWKPLPLWYAFWALLAAGGAVASLASGAIVAGLAGFIVSGLIGWYVHYLYNGGRYRVWFIFF
jgi:hypothetical protein